MRKRRFILFAMLLATVVLVVAVVELYVYLKKDVVYIAIVGPKTSVNSGEIVEFENMRNGVALYLDKIRQTGELPNTRIELLEVDDHNDPQIAKEAALKLAQENKVLLVLGHSYSATSFEGGKVYRKYEIPAITASSTAENVTLGNAWYFRVIPNNTFQATFLALYIKNSLKKNAIVIIAINDDYGRSLARALESTANEIGLPVLKNWEINTYSPDWESAVDQLLTEIAAMDDLGAIVLATYGDTAADAKIIASLHNSKKKYVLIGGDSFSDTAFLYLFETYPQQGGSPDYYSDGIYVTTPFMPQIADKEAYDFKKRFAKKYPDNASPSWYVACYYDAMRVAVEAIKLAKIQGRGHIRSKRKAVRDALTSFYSVKTAIKGVTGLIYFDQNRNVTRPFAVGRYTNRSLLPAFTQYQIISNLENVEEDLIQAALEGRIVLVNDQIVMENTQVVQTEIRLQNVRWVNWENARYLLDFWVGFRFQGTTLDAANIAFLNGKGAIERELIAEQTDDNVTTQVYHFKGEFTCPLDRRGYPFDSPVLSLKFRHANRMISDVIYVPTENIIDFSQFSIKPPHVPSMIAVSSYQDVINNVTTFGSSDFSPITYNYSRLNVDIPITRPNMVVNLIWMTVFVILAAMLCTMFMLPENWIGWRTSIGGGVLIVNACVHFQWLLPDSLRSGMTLDSLRIAYIVTFEYIVFAVYILTLLATFFSISVYVFYRRRLGLLKGIYLFQSFSDQMKSSLSKKMRRRRFRKPGRVIIRQGNKGDSLFVIIEGEVGIWVKLEDGRMLEIGRRKAGEFIGEMALLTGEVRTADVISVTPAFLGEVTKADLMPFLKKKPEIVQSMSDTVARRKIEEALKKGEQIDEQELSAKLTEKIKKFYGFK